MITDGDTQETMKGFSDLADEAVALGRRFVIENTQERFSALSALFIARACQALTSAGILANRGAIGDAMSVARTVVELEFEHAFIMQTDTENRWLRYTAREVIHRDHHIQAIAALHGGKVDQQAVAHSRRRAAAAEGRLGTRAQRKRRRQVAAGAVRDASIRDRAVAAGRQQQYDVVYADMCGASHGGFATLWYVTKPASKPPFEILVGYPPADSKPLALATQAFLQLLAVAIDSAGAASFEPELKLLADRLVAMPRQRNAPQPTVPAT